MAERVGFLFINGLGDGSTTPKDRVVSWWWQRAGLDIHHAHINWYNGVGLEAKLDELEHQVDGLLQSYGGVAIIGSSAGGSLAINAFLRKKDKNVCAVNAHGRVKAGDYPKEHRMSLYRRAHLDGSRPSQSFFDSVTKAEELTIPALTEQDKQRLLVLSQLTDMVVPKECVSIDGVQGHRSIAFGHSGGFMAHLLADRDIISDFANSATHLRAK